MSMLNEGGGNGPISGFCQNLGVEGRSGRTRGVFVCVGEKS